MILPTHDPTETFQERVRTYGYLRILLIILDRMTSTQPFFIIVSNTQLVGYGQVVMFKQKTQVYSLNRRVLYIFHH